MSGYLDKLREHKFDDIQEFDNYLPRWWLWSFYLACIFAAVYWLYYHGSNFGLSSVERYNLAMKEKLMRDAATKPVTREMLLDFAKQPDAIKAGEAIFVGTCAQCHKPDGSGQAGPNLTDNHWLHGGKIEDIYRTVAKGSPTNIAMVAWEPTLGRTKCMQVVAYLMTIKNTNRPGLPPQGEPEK